MTRRLLLNWVYYLPAGHVVEALQHAHGYHVANPEVEISLLLNADAGAALRLTEGCPWLAGEYAVSVTELAAQGQETPSLRAVPQSWDYIVHDPRVLPGKMVPGWDEEELMAAQPVIQAYLEATIWSGASPGFEARWNTEGLLAIDTPLPFQPNAPLRLAVPAEARSFAERYRHDGPAIAILPVSTAGLAQSPTPAAWTQVCAAFAEAFPGVPLYITGITYVNDEGQRVGFDFGPEDAERIAAQVPGVEACFDIGMWNQLALIERCDLFCSPHTGFAFLAPYVGTPWLTISGCPWPEYHFNAMPFYSALPECPNYPASAHKESECMRRWFENRQPDCMSDAAIERRMPDIVAGARLLLEKRLGFKEACRLHMDKLRAAGHNPAEFGYFG